MNRLLEDSRNTLINKSKRGDDYDPSNRNLGRNRHQRRLKSRIANSVKEYNQINMNKLFKEDILDVNVRVNGETDVYLVKISFNGFLNSLAGYMQHSDDENDLDFRKVLRALLDAFNHNDVYVHCTCPDWQYRQAYWATINGINAGPAENRPSDETNPNDTKGAGCKHINLVLNNNSWMMKVASVINNYIKYMREHMPKLYQTVIYPAVFDREYIPPEELDYDGPEEPNEDEILDNQEEAEPEELPSDEDAIDTSNKWARTKNQFKKGNQSGIQFAKKSPELDIDSIDTENQNDIED